MHYLSVFVRVLDGTSQDEAAVIKRLAVRIGEPVFPVVKVRINRVLRGSVIVNCVSPATIGFGITDTRDTNL